jgi:hypothetical protein
MCCVSFHFQDDVDDEVFELASTTAVTHPAAIRKVDRVESMMDVKGRTRRGRLRRFRSEPDRSNFPPPVNLREMGFT